MHKSILMYTDIDKCPKVNYITYGSFKDHAFFQVLHIKYICSQYRLRHLITRISCRFFQLFDNVTKCRFTNAKLFCQFFVILNLSGNTTQFANSDIFWFVSQFFQNLLRSFIAFRMNTCRIQRILSACDTCKTCTLFKCFRSEFCNFEKLTTTFKSSVLFPISHDVLRNHFTDT